MGLCLYISMYIPESVGGHVLLIQVGPCIYRHG